ncbi:MAG: Heavy-metal transporting P-type ATPase [Clostridia bacterium 41_269]|nr:MAG: Heavy-metal transporting P-type ATPase [Clostridia bacterium 41_269]
MTLSTAGAILIHHLPEAVGVMLFYYLGEILQDAAVNRSRRSIKDLLDIRPDYANLKTDNGIKTIPPQEVSEGNLIVIKPGEKIPLDGIVVEGTSFIDTSALTGESLPRRVKPGDKILAGMVNSTGLLTVKVIKTYEESSASKILKLVEQAGERKASTEKFITKFSRYYTPAVVFVSIIIAFVPPLTIEGAAFKDWFYRALTLLVISCPCALVISIPLGFFGGIGGASKRGILIKGANFLEALTNIHTAAFDKTGTLTWGVFKVSKIETLNLSPNKLLYYAAAAEYYSNHPIAKSILERYRETNTNPIDPKIIKNYREIPGYGVKAEINGRKVVVGSAGLMQKEKIKSMPASNPHSNTTVYVAIDGIFAGIIYISDEIKEDAKLTIKKLKELGVKRIVMLTGDSQKSAEEAAKKIGINEYYADLLPQDKVKLMEKLITEKKNEKGYVVFVGDGINDAPVLARADIGVAVEGSASDAAIEAADVVLMGSSPSKLVEAVKIAYFTKKLFFKIFSWLWE